MFAGLCILRCGAYKLLDYELASIDSPKYNIIVYRFTLLSHPINEYFVLFSFQLDDDENDDKESSSTLPNIVSQTTYTHSNSSQFLTITRRLNRLLLLLLRALLLCRAFVGQTECQQIHRGAQRAVFQP